MKLYTYYISIVSDDGLSSIDEKATSRVDAFKKLKTMKDKYINKSFLKESDSVELYIDRAFRDGALYDCIYYKKIK